MRTARGLRVHVLLERDGVIADDRRTDDNTESLLNSDVVMKERTNLITAESAGKDYEASSRRSFPAQQEEFDSSAVLNLHSAFIQGDILNQTDRCQTKCLTLIDNADADPNDVRNLLNGISSFESEYLTDVTFVVSSENRRCHLEKQCKDIFLISRNEDNDVNRNRNNVLSPKKERHTTSANTNVTNSLGFSDITSIDMTCEGRIRSTNLNNSGNIMSAPSSPHRELNDNNSDAEAIDVIGTETSQPAKDKNGVTLSTLQGEFEPLLNQGEAQEDEMKVTVTDQIVSGFRKIVQIVMDTMVSVKTEDEDVQPYGEPS